MPLAPRCACSHTSAKHKPDASGRIGLGRCTTCRDCFLYWPYDISMSASAGAYWRNRAHTKGHDHEETQDAHKSRN